MKRTLKKQKAEIKERFNAEIDKYYAEIETGLKSESLKIAGIERMMKEKKARMEKMIEEATGEAVVTTENIGKKNCVRNVAER